MRPRGLLGHLSLGLRQATLLEHHSSRLKSTLASKLILTGGTTTASSFVVNTAYKICKQFWQSLRFRQQPKLRILDQAVVRPNKPVAQVCELSFWATDFKAVCLSDREIVEWRGRRCESLLSSEASLQTVRKQPTTRSLGKAKDCRTFGRKHRTIPVLDRRQPCQRKWCVVYNFQIFFQLVHSQFHFQAF